MNAHSHPHVRHSMNTLVLQIEFVVTPSEHGPVVRVSVEDLARATGLDVEAHYDLPLLDRDLAVATVALAGGAASELRAIGAAFERARLSAAPVATVLTMRPTAAPALPHEATVTGAALLADRNAREKAAIVGALDAANGNKVRAAQRVGMARRTFYRRLREYGLMDDDGAPPVVQPVVVEAPVSYRRKPGRPRKTA